MKLSIFLSFIFYNLMVHGQDTTKVVIDLNDLKNEIVSVQVYPPVEKTSWEYVIPEIIPGTYMKVDYVRFYNKVEAFDDNGDKVKVKKSKNVFRLSSDQPISYLRYTVEPTLGDKRVWNNILTCAGSAYNDESALINFQVLNGYFEGYEDQAFQIEISKPKGLFGSSSIDKKTFNEEKDILFADNYGELIDQPILYATADTTSFRIEENTFKIAVYAEAGKITAEILKPRFEMLMEEIGSFSGFTSEKDYYFIFYYVDPEQQKGMFKNFGKGSALEHKNSSIYYNDDIIYDSTFSIYNWIGAHEYYHTITPLNLHSEKIDDFKFRKPDMSRHVWMYEGVTDYLAMLLNSQSKKLNQSARNDLAFATQTSLNRSKQSMTESGRNIIRKKNIFSWIKKIYDLDNFYEKGKLIAFAMDLELMERSNGERRLLDIMLEMKKDYDDTYFTDTELLTILEKYTYSGFKEQFKPYIEGTDLPPFEAYFNKLGWTFYPEKTKLPTYGRFYWLKNPKSNSFYVPWEKGNELDLTVGDSVLTVNNIPVQEFMDTKRAYYETIVYPKVDDHLTVEVNRDGKVLKLEAEPKLKKLKYARMKVNGDPSEAQKAFRKVYFYRDSDNEN